MLGNKYEYILNGYWETDETGGSTGEGDNKGNEKPEDKGSGESEIDYTKLDPSKIPFDVLVKAPEYQKVKTEAEKNRKKNAELRKAITEDDQGEKLPGDKSDESDNKDIPAWAKPLIQSVTKLTEVVGEESRNKLLKTVQAEVNKDEKGNERLMLSDEHLEFIKGNTHDEMLASAKNVITKFGLDKRTFETSVPGGNAGKTGNGIQELVKRKMTNSGNGSPFAPGQSIQKGT